jgi:RHH-type proline utilization regulon transcriptional repressor/proline dehydrogenase/delta 1-pyrroline-5-carboxylate dehydrogenase
MDYTLAESGAEIAAAARRSEQEVVTQQAEELKRLYVRDADVEAKFRDIITKLRRKGGATDGIEAFLHQYGLNTSEGVAVMCLAEALLRIPDSDTADRLIRDKFEDAEWEKHLGNSDHWFVNASSWGLMLTGKMVEYGYSDQKKLLHRIAGKIGNPSIREALRIGMKVIGSKFVLGETIEEAVKHSKPQLKRGYRYSYDMLGEGARTEEQAEAFCESYAAAIEAIGKSVDQKMPLYARPNISIKLTALHPRYEFVHKDEIEHTLLARLVKLVRAAKEYGLSVSIDAEEARRLELHLLVFERLIEHPDLQDWDGLGMVVQAYQKAALPLLNYLAKLARQHERKIPVRLVKGAYWDAEIKHAQEMGLAEYPVFTRKEFSDQSYLLCAYFMLRNTQSFYPQFATHNARTMADVLAYADAQGVAHDAFEFQRLHGMGEMLHDEVVGTVSSRIYAPVGEHKDLLAYLIRRLLENGANTSFVHLLVDKDVTIDDLMQSVVEQVEESFCMPNPAIPLPSLMYGSRENSAGIEQGNSVELQRLLKQIGKWDDHHWDFAAAGRGVKSLSPTDGSVVGTFAEATAGGLAEAIGRAAAAQAAWAARSVEERAQVLEAVGQALSDNEAELIALCRREAGKVLQDAIDEVREAVDFCRYYALEARKLMAIPQTMPGPTGEHDQLQLFARGVFACISPWNFPLAIFTGQVAAALVTGNAVMAKPAEQTPLIATRAVQLMHEAGVPQDVLQLVCGDGETIGAPLVADARISGVVFTGSVPVAKAIQRSLAEKDGPIVPLIAETGGQNCMVVDSSALPEQATDDIIRSAFGSAGQRCSALRVLYVQDDIADVLIPMIQGAMQQLNVGDPCEVTTDIGPVIDDEAQAKIAAHIARLKKDYTLVGTAPMKEGLSGHFIAPHAFEIPSIDALQEEIFGPVLHIVRFDDSDYQAVADAINSTGYGLTFGIHSRIEDNIRFFVERVKAGNLYVNRGMTGAVVGVQPFGGEGLSGTGPKAGGPFYLLRFVTERTISNNTAAIGGNLELLIDR